MLARAAPVLRHRDYRLLMTGQAVSLIGDGLLLVVMAFAVIEELGGSAAEVGLVLGARTLALAVLVLGAGVWADRVSRRNLMLVSDAGRAATQAVLAALLLTGEATVGAAIALSAAYGAFEALFRPAAGGLIPQLVPPEDLQEANALYALAFTLGFILGPALGGVLLAALGAGGAIAVDAATFVVGAAFLLAMRVPR